MKLIRKILDALEAQKLKNYDKCYLKRMQEGKTVDDGCYGLMGGDRCTDFLCEGCITCPHLTFKRLRPQETE